MLIVKINSLIIARGDTVEIRGGDNFKFKVLEILPNSFKVKWLSGNVGDVGVIPHSLFAEIGQPITVVEIPDKDDPNLLFLRKRSKL